MIAQGNLRAGRRRSHRSAYDLHLSGASSLVCFDLRVSPLAVETVLDRFAAFDDFAEKLASRFYKPGVSEDKVKNFVRHVVTQKRTDEQVRVKSVDIVLL